MIYINTPESGTGLSGSVVYVPEIGPICTSLLSPETHPPIVVEDADDLIRAGYPDAELIRQTIGEFLE